MQQLPRVPDELHVVKYEASMLDIEPDWTRFVGDSFAQVIDYYAQRFGI